MSDIFSIWHCRLLLFGLAQCLYIGIAQYLYNVAFVLWLIQARMYQVVDLSCHWLSICHFFCRSSWFASQVVRKWVHNTNLDNFQVSASMFDSMWLLLLLLTSMWIKIFEVLHFRPFYLVKTNFHLIWYWLEKFNVKIVAIWNCFRKLHGRRNEYLSIFSSDWSVGWSFSRCRNCAPDCSSLRRIAE